MFDYMGFALYTHFGGLVLGQGNYRVQYSREEIAMLHPESLESQSHMVQGLRVLRVKG